MKPLDEIINALDADALEHLTAYLLLFVNPDRVERIDDALSRRTRYLTVVLENIHQPRNASAVVRSCECFGIQDLHVIESSNAFQVNRNIVQGAAKWVTVHRHRGPGATRSCLQGFKRAGCRIVAMDPGPGSMPLAALPIDAPLVLCFGSEEPGLTEQVRSMADASAMIPMQGFTRSLNLSVSAGIALERIGARIRCSDRDWKLGTVEGKRLRALWLARSISAGRRIVDRYLGGRS